MKDILSYKDFIGSVHFSADDKVFYGKIEGIDDLVTFEGQTVEELISAFQEEVDDYIALCEKTGKKPSKSCKGSLNVRIPPEMHLKATLKAAMLGISLNQLIRRALEKEVL